jgi:hypothetical protein
LTKPVSQEMFDVGQDFDGHHTANATAVKSQ